jgi:hypothetical protein
VLSANLFLCLIALFAGFTQGLSGFGSVLVALPLLAVFLDFQTAVPLASTWGMTINVILLLQLRSHVRLKKILPLTVASLPGIPLGVYALQKAPVWILEILLGGLLLVFSLYFVWSGGKTRHLAQGWAYAAGLTSGFLGGSLAASGPPVIVYTAMQPWPKDEIKSTLTGFFFLSGLAILAAQAVGCLFTSGVLTLSLISIPVVVLGVFVGTWCYDKLDTIRYRQVIIVLISLLGLFTLVKALGER